MKSETKTNTFLAHYGVKGMKWGVRKDRTKGSSGKRSSQKTSGNHTRVGSDEFAAQVALGAGLTALSLVNLGVQSGKFTQMATRGKKFVTRRDGMFKKDETLSSSTYSADQIMENVVPGINPDYGKWGTNMNCRRATFAYEMRRRGYDVEATKTSTAHGGDAAGLRKAAYSDSKKKDLKGMDLNAGESKISINEGSAAKDIFSTLDKQPNGSRGELTVRWKSPVPGIPGGGHSVAYEVINGKSHIFDTQVGKEYSRNDEVFDSVGSAAHTRLDNKDLNQKHLAKWMK